MAGAEMNNLPSTLRYYAGGAGSVRGYSYQAIGPRNHKDDPSGGRSYQIVNLEARYKITDEIGIVPFLDGGMVYEDAPAADLRGHALGRGPGPALLHAHRSGTPGRGHAPQSRGRRSPCNSISA